MPNSLTRDALIASIRSAYQSIISSTTATEPERIAYRAEFDKTHGEIRQSIDTFCTRRDGVKFSYEANAIISEWNQIQKIVKTIVEAPDEVAATLGEVIDRAVSAVHALDGNLEDSVVAEPGAAELKLDTYAPDVLTDSQMLSAGWVRNSTNSELLGIVTSSLSEMLTRLNADNATTDAEKAFLRELLQTSLAQLEGPWLNSWLWNFLRERLMSIVSAPVDTALKLALGALINEAMPTIDIIIQSISN